MLGLRAFLKTRRVPVLLGVAFLIAVFLPLSTYTTLAFSGHGVVVVPISHFLGVSIGIVLGIAPYTFADDIEHLREDKVRLPQFVLALVLLCIGIIFVASSSVLCVSLGSDEPFFSPISQVRSFIFLVSLGYISSALFGKETSWVIGALYIAYTLYFGYTWAEKPTMWNMWDAPPDSSLAWAMALASLAVSSIALLTHPSRPVFTIR